jgi:hypothetical protein
VILGTEFFLKMASYVAYELLGCRKNKHYKFVSCYMGNMSDFDCC